MHRHRLSGVLLKLCGGKTVGTRNARSTSVSIPLAKKFSSKNPGPLADHLRNVSRLRTVALLSAAKTDGRGLSDKKSLFEVLWVAPVVDAVKDIHEPLKLRYKELRKG